REAVDQLDRDAAAQRRPGVDRRAVWRHLALAGRAGDQVVAPGAVEHRQPAAAGAAPRRLDEQGDGGAYRIERVVAKPDGGGMARLPGRRIAGDDDTSVRAIG